MVVAYGVSCLLCVAGSMLWLARAWRGFPPETARPPRRELWSRLLPLAGWIMLINFLWNLFDVVDRYMIVHLLPGTPAEALAEVGNYRSSRVLPLLLSSITVMVAGALLPHLSHDWEAGRRRQVSQRLNMFFKIWSLLLTGGAAAVLLVAPVLFRVGFQSKFAGGLHVLPWTLTYCTWFGLSMLLQTYLWCAERASAASLVALFGRAGERRLEPRPAAADGAAGRSAGHVRRQRHGAVLDARPLPPPRTGRAAGHDHRAAHADQHSRRPVGRRLGPGRRTCANHGDEQLSLARRKRGDFRGSRTVPRQTALAVASRGKQRESAMPRFTFLTSLAELRAAAPDWDDLWRRSDCTSPLARAEMVAHWLEHFAPQARFCAAVVEEDGRWLAALPLVEGRGRGILRAGVLPCNEWPSGATLLWDVSGTACEVGCAMTAALDRLPWHLVLLEVGHARAAIVACASRGGKGGGPALRPAQRDGTLAG